MYHLAADPAAVQNLALTTGADLKAWVLLIAGNVFIVILVVRSIGYYAKREWGELIGHILVAILIAGFVFATDTSVGLLKDLWGKVSGA
ncbi:hypothetical protein ACWCXH_35285 [Kitasatospora sp. NPDC001660]